MEACVVRLKSTSRWSVATEGPGVSIELLRIICRDVVSESLDLERVSG